MHYVIGDVHGCYDELMALLNKIEAKDDDARIIFTGDLIDRGPKVMDVLTWAMDHITLDGKYQAVRGNHEQLVIEWFVNFLLWWSERGTGSGKRPMPKTYYDFWLQMADSGCLSPEKTLPYIRFFEARPFSMRLKLRSAYGKEVTYRIVHAWYNFKEPADSEKQLYCNLWERNYYGHHHKNSDAADIIIHGHTPTIVKDYYLRGMFFFSDAPGMICYRPGAVNLDGGCCYSPHFGEYPCMLCAFCLETLEEIYPYALTERFAGKIRADGLTAEGAVDTESIQAFAKERTDAYEKKFRKKVPSPRLKLLKHAGGE